MHRSPGVAAAFNEELSYSTQCAKLLGISGPNNYNPLVKMAMVRPSYHIVAKLTYIYFN